MRGLNGFSSLTLISSNPVHQVYRALRVRDQRAVILKVLDSLSVGREDLARLRHEFQMLSQQSQSGWVQALEWQQDDNLFMLVLEDDQAEDLASALNRDKFPLPHALQLMLSMTRCVGQAHQRGIIHRDINPANLILLPDQATIKLIDFGIALQHLNGLRDDGQAPALAGSLRYIAPEQTGKMNRHVDYRADYYSLGVTFYEMLLGRPPFDSLDPHELIHAHIAKRPVPPAEIDQQVPLIVSNLIMKLLAKNAEQRYQSSHGIEMDLQRCLDVLAEEGREGLQATSWPLGANDRSSTFSIPEKLYGREKELQILFRGFVKVRQGKKSLFLVSGHSGIGKTALVRELHKPVLDGGGVLVFGKFDQLQRDVPYRGLVLALQQWTRQLLSMSDQHLKQWRLRLQQAVEGNGGILVDLIPELETVLGPQPVVQSVDPIQFQQLFNHVVLNLMGAIASADHPLVLALDDVQWADAGSLHLIELLLTSPDISHLMLVGLFRDNEVDEQHPLMLAIESLQKKGAVPDAVSVQPLALDALQQLVQDTFGCEHASALFLAQILLEKTQGNPFFVEEFLTSLVRENVIAFDFSAAVWRWDESSLKLRTATLNVVELLLKRLRDLPPQTLHVLQIASCSGFQFLLTDLLAVAPYEPGAVISALNAAASDAIIQPVGDAYLADATQPDLELIRQSRLSYCFLHDRIHQAVYDSIAVEEVSVLHQRIGQRLHDQADDEARDSNIFTIARHFNAAASLLHDSAAIRLHLEVNYRAAVKAIEASAFENAYRLLAVASELMDEQVWRDHHDFSVKFYLKLVEASYLNAQYEQMQQYFNKLQQHVQNTIELLPAYQVLMRALSRQGRTQEAVDIGVDVARQFNYPLKHNPTQLDVLWRLIKTKLFLWRKIGNKKMMDIPAISPMQDKTLMAIYDHVFEVAGLSFLARPNVFATVSLQGVTITFVDGLSRTTPTAYAAYGVLHVGLFNQIEKGVDYMRFALSMAEQVGDPLMLVASTQLYNGFVRHWKEPLRESLKGLLWVHRRGAEIAYLEYSCHGANLYLAHSWFCGAELEELAIDAEKFGKLAHRYGYAGLAQYAELLHQLIVGMQGFSQQPTLFQGDFFDETQFDFTTQLQVDAALVLYYRLFKLQVCYYFGEFNNGLTHATECRPLLRAAPGAFVISILYLYEALCCLRLALAGSLERRSAWRTIKIALKKHGHWQKHCNDNFENKVLLLQGALCFLDADHLRALQLFEQAATSSRRHGFLQERAMAFELAAHCAHALSLPGASADYLHEAAVFFQKWGAKEKVSQLRQTPLTQKTDDKASVTYGGTTRTIGNNALDIASLRKALKDISEEKVHTRLIAKTIQSTAEFAGSQNAMLLLDRGGDLRIEAQLTSDMVTPVIMQSQPVTDDLELLVVPVVNLVTRTLASVVIADAQQLQEQIPGLNKVPCVMQRQVRSIMALPLLEGIQGERTLIGVLYLENNLTSDAFTTGMIEALEIIGLAAAGRLELSRKAVTDGLTGLFNHDFFQQQMAEQCHLAGRYKRALSVILLDIDHFKKFNDNWGHQVGDIVLKQVAETMRQCCRVSDVVARYGGEEMAVILPETDETAALAVAEKIRSAIEALAIYHEGQELRVTASVGVCAWSEKATVPAELVRSADEALYACKAAGRNCVSSANRPPLR